MNRKIGIVGATGIVGAQLIVFVDERKTPVVDSRVSASEKSDGKGTYFKIFS
jgi:aspartate-semialdehyde dehydrogenase